MRLPQASLVRQDGYALVMTMLFGGLAMVALSGAMEWSSTNSRLTARHNQYQETLLAAEAATEKVLSRMIVDFKRGDEARVYNNLELYRGMVPNAAENAAWSRYLFGDVNGTPNRMTVENTQAWGFTPLQSQYQGLYGLAASYRVLCNARRTDALNDITVAVEQNVQVATIPVFQFAIFYGLTMEISCGQPFNVTGRVHSNRDLYVCPDNALTFWTDVTSVGNIRWGRAPGDSRGAPSGTVTYRGAHDSGVSSLNLPIGTNNSPEAVRAILEVPPTGEDPNSLMGKQRFYNKADLILTVSDTVITNITGVTSNRVGGVWQFTTNYSFTTNIILAGKTGPLSPGGAATVGPSVLQTFVNVAPNNAATNSFYDSREGKRVLPIDIDVGRMRTNTALTSALGRDVTIIYVEDKRTRSVNPSTQLGAVRMVNGRTLPTRGLTVATDRPMYVLGHYNAPNTSNLGSTNTVGTAPAALLGDAITVLSTAWRDDRSTSSLDSRPAEHTTVNAAFLAGIVETLTYNSYSGGVENFPRFLEDWNPSSGKRTFTYNGSMVVLFPSQYATARWGLSGVYDPPARNWAFDLNFMDAKKLPPGTPSVSTLIRGSWKLATPKRPGSAG
ncbi:MAG: hypothetical protein N3J91_07245 [Verrucomicrobiae bacterium]|nr:hypothetical protein [Verrucomicrobiae bacterium]